MAVKLRLRRIGKKKQPFYRIVVTDSRIARGGKYIEKIGHYNPLVDPPDILINEERTFLWLGRGAIPTDTVKSLLSKKGILLRWHLMRRNFPQDRIDEEMKKWEVLQIEKRKREEALEAQKEREAKQKLDEELTKEDATEETTEETKTKEEETTTKEKETTEETTKEDETAEVVTEESIEEKKEQSPESIEKDVKQTETK